MAGGFKQQVGPALARRLPPMVGGVTMGRLGAGASQVMEQAFQIKGRQTVVTQGEQIEGKLVLLVELVGRQEGGKAGDAGQVRAVDAGGGALFLGSLQARREMEHCLQAPSAKTEYRGSTTGCAGKHVKHQWLVDSS